MTDHIKKSNFKKLCRICLLQSTKKQLVTSDIIEKLEICTSVKILLNDGLPSKICVRCKQNTEKFYEFKLKCKASDKLLKSILNGIDDQKPSCDELDIKYLIPLVTISDQSIKKENDLSNVNSYSSVKTEDDSSNSNELPLSESDSEQNAPKLKDIINDSSKTKACSETNDADTKPNADSKYRFICRVCGKGYNMRKRLQAHEYIHLNLRPFNCSKCDKNFRGEAHLNSHIARVHNPDRKKPKCNVCGKSVVHIGLHMARHSTERPYKCDFCALSFPVKWDCIKHMQIHTGERKFTTLCSACGKQCQSPKDLRIHMRKHTGERPHSCDTCGKTYKTASALVVHKRSHTGERPHRCDMCDKAFYTKEVLKAHLRIHTGERPFVCKICQRAFSQNQALNTHMKIH